jgi:hypothetical protein
VGLSIRHPGAWHDGEDVVDSKFWRGEGCTGDQYIGKQQECTFRLGTGINNKILGCLGGDFICSSG